MATKIEEAIVIPDENPSTPEQPFQITIENAVHNQIAKLDKFDSRLQELKDKYSGLKIKDSKDKPGHEAMKKAVSDLRSIRTGTDNDRKDMKAPLIAAGKSIENKANWIITEIEKIELPLIEQIREYDAAKEKEKLAENAMKEARLEKRVTALKLLGADFTGTGMLLEDGETRVFYDTKMLGGVEDDIFEVKMLPRYQEVFEAKEKVRIAAKEAKELEEKLQKEATEKFKADQRKLKEDQDKLELQKKEAEKETARLLKEKVEIRQKELYTFGLSHHYATGAWTLGELKVTAEQVENWTDEMWKHEMEKLGPKAEAEKKVIQEAAVKETERLNALAVAKALREKKEKEDLEKAENQRKAQEASDKVKYEDIVSYLEATPKYEFTSKHFKAKYKIIRDFLADLK